MEVNGEEERSRREDEEKEVYYHSLLNSPCSAFHKTVQAILKCLGLESSSTSSSSSSSSPSEEEDPGTEIVQETGFMAMVTRLARRRPRPPYSSGSPGQIN
ncbi:elicitor peptide 6 [Eutrema salsugineum]|uniref:elicitor peptide 6 n=1 Tax=Eutrema salsugineum TaxID=72664 RepID=UPI000CECEE1D|nr:elicitor peptide 6 [Eutrema salsugineum]